MNRDKNIIPLLIAFLVLLSGFLNIYSAFFSHRPLRMAVIEELFPLVIIHASRTLTLLSGFFLVFLSFGLANRKFRAWWMALAVLALSLCFHVAKGLDWEEAALLFLPLALLLAYNGEFTVRSSTVTLLRRAKVSLLVLIALFLYSTAGFFLLQGQFTRPVTWGGIYRDYEYTVIGAGQETLTPTTRRAGWFEDSMGATGFAALFSVLAIIFGPAAGKRQATEKEMRLAKKIIATSGSHPASYFLLMGDKRFFFSPDGQCMLGYKISAGTAMVLGDPAGTGPCLPGFIESFSRETRQQGLSPAFYLATEKALPSCKALGFKALKVGEEAIVEIGKFNLNCPELKTVRNSHNRLKRERVNFAWHTMSDLPWRELSQIQDLHRQWLASRKAKPMSFSMDFFPFPPEPEGRVLTVFDRDRKLLGAFSFLPYAQGRGLVLDLMLRDSRAPNGLIEGSLAEAIEKAGSLGKAEVSLGLAAASYSQTPASLPLAQKAVDFLYQNVNFFYNYQSLAKFKAKFRPQWQPRYLVYGGETELPKTVLALARAQMPHALINKIGFLT
jgi:phosphatidylglycerol lysyltransferase